METNTPKQETITPIEQRPVVIDKSVYDVLLESEAPADAIALYNFYYYTAIWQKTNRPRATKDYVMRGLKMGESRFSKAYKILQKAGLVIRVQSAEGKAFGKTYIQVNYYAKKDTVEQFTGTAFLRHPVKQDTNAYSTNNLNAYSSDSKKINKLENKMRYLLDIPDNDLKQLSEVYLASISQVKEKGEALYDWCLTNGKRKKNYKAFLQGALRRDYGKRQFVNARAEYQPLLATEEVRDEGLDFRSLIKH